jgi:hypothetical protein
MCSVGGCTAAGDVLGLDGPWGTGGAGDGKPHGKTRKIYWKHPKHIETMDFGPQMIFGSSDFRTGLSGAWKELSSSMN